MEDDQASKISHDLKNHLAVLKAFAHLLHQRLQSQGDEKLLHYVSQIDHHTDEMTAKINQLFKDLREGK